MISDIGSTDNTALLCITNHPPTEGGGRNSGGDWFAPDETRVNSDDVPGFRRNRDPMVVRLLRNSLTPVEGIYYCVVRDASNIELVVSIGLYYSHNNTGILA